MNPQANKYAWPKPNKPQCITCACAAIELCVDKANYQVDDPTDIWQKFYSQRKKRYYYYNILTKKVGIGPQLIVRSTVFECCYVIIYEFIVFCKIVS